jgi:ferredoxin
MAESIRVRFEPSGIQLDVPEGERVLDTVDEHPALGLPTACRAGNCGACLVQVGIGEDALLEPADRERTTLAELGAGSQQRLGCQLRIRGDLGTDCGPIVLVVVRR